jgi:hypothetical protein
LFVIPAQAETQCLQIVVNRLDPGAFHGHDPGFAGVTAKKTFYELVIVEGKHSILFGSLKTSIGPSAKARGVLESGAYLLICEHFKNAVQRRITA